MKDSFSRSAAVPALLILCVVLSIFFLPIDDNTSKEEVQPTEEIAVEEPRACFKYDDSALVSFASTCFNCIPPKPNLNPEGKIFFEKFKPMLDEVTIPKVTMEMESIGKYWVTNYCPAECGGSWATSSGATCHRASYENRLTEPTTCAIDLSVGDYGDLYYLPSFDRVFIAEDTGSGVKGKWLDLFYEDYSDVVNFPVGYYEVYSVEYVYGEVPANTYSIQPYMQQPFVDALEEYNHEPYAEVTIIQINPTPFKKIVIVNIDVDDIEKKTMVVPYI